MEELQEKIEQLEQEVRSMRSKQEQWLPSIEFVEKHLRLSDLSLFNTPVRVSANIGAQAGGKGGLFIGSGPFGIYYGSGAPTISASKGSLYLRTDGSSTSTRAYVNTDGGTTWTNITTAA